MRHFRSAVLVMCVASVAAACGGGEEPALEETSGPRAQASFAPDSYMSTIKTAGKLRVGVKYDVPQFGLLKPGASKPEGFDVDMGQAIADTIGVPAEFSEAVSANRVPFLQTDKVDIVFSTMTINEERKQQIDFSDVYYVAGQSFLVKKGEALTIQTAADKNVCTARGSTSEKNLLQLQPRAKVTLQEGYSQCFQLLQNDQVDAVTTDDVILVQFIQRDPANYQLSGGTFSKEPYGAGIKKGHPEFVEFVNGVISDMKEDGTWKTMYDKWIGSVTAQSATPPPDEVEAQVGTESPAPSPTR